MHHKEPVTTDITPDEFALWKHNEHLAHVLPTKLQKAYDKKALPETLKLVDNDGIEREYTPKKVKIPHSGLVCFILAPTDNDNHRMHVLFRGTHNVSGVHRDLKLNAPGTTSYHQHKSTINAAIEEAVTAMNHNKSISLSIAGHSLGGSDTQNCASNILKEMALNPKGILGTSIGTLNIIHKNSPGISQKSAVVAKSSVEAIRSNPKTQAIKINYYPIIIARDMAQKAGYTSLFGDMDADQVNTKLLKADLGKNSKLSYWALLFDGPITWVKRIAHNAIMLHKFKVFNEADATTKTVNATARVEVFDNTTMEGKLAIDKELNNKAMQKIYNAVTSGLPSTKAISSKFTASKAKVAPQPVPVTTNKPKFKKDE